MPIRVRCRCGQEVVLRYGDWVYVFLGLVLLSVVINMLVLLLLYFRLDGQPPPPGPGEPAREVNQDAAGSSAAAPTLPSGDAEGAARPPAEGPRPERPAEKAAPAQEPAGRAARGPAASGKRRALTTAQVSKEFLRSLDRAGPPFAGPGGSTAPAPSTPRERSPEQTSPPPSARLDVPAVLRLRLAAGAGGGAVEPEPFLADPDPLVRRVAVERALQAPRHAAGSPAAKRARVWLGAAREILARDPQGRRLLDAAGLGSGAPWTAGARGGEDLRALVPPFRQRVDSALSEPAPQSLRRYLESLQGGLDVVLVVDISRSMEEALARIRRDAAWALPALVWMVPGARIGLVFYRDDVESVVGLSPDPRRDVLPALEAARAEGGGDVPEGVHRAMREALSLGRCAWRTESRKHLVILADALPPHAEQEGLLLLASQAFHQGGYRTDVLSFEPREEIRPRRPFFSALSRQGGGSMRRMEPADDPGTEFLRCLFPGAAQPALESVYLLLPRLFSA